MEYLGRKDNFVKIRGQKVNLQEIADALKAIDSSVGVSVQAKFLEDKMSVTNITHLLHRATLSVTELEEKLKRRLPMQMIPKLIMVNEFPLAPASGKIDRMALINLIPQRISI